MLRGLNLSILPGQTVALVGKSGCGKSTAVALMEQLYQPTGGVIKLDGRPLAELDVDYVRKHIAYVTQQVYERELGVPPACHSGVAPAHKWLLHPCRGRLL